VQAYVAASEVGTPDADFDGSGFVPSYDFDANLVAFEAGVLNHVRALFSESNKEKRVTPACRGSPIALLRVRQALHGVAGTLGCGRHCEPRVTLVRWT